VTGAVNWICGKAPEEAVRVQVKIRYKARMAWGWVTPREDGSAEVRLDEPARDVTSGQAAVFYGGAERDSELACLGGGIILPGTPNIEMPG
jgi:tRNA-uridine 2-sulfurtransferase